MPVDVSKHPNTQVIQVGTPEEDPATADTIEVPAATETVPAPPEERPSWHLLAPPIALVRGRLYSALLHLSWAEKAFATPGAIEEKLEGAGFAGITVDMNASGGPRASGTWAGASAEDVSLPEEIATVWEWR